MTSFDEQIDLVAPQPRRRNLYRLDFRAGADGIARSMEFYAPNITHALAQALSDPAKRTAYVWENGDFVCSISREPIAVKMAQD